MSTHTILQNLRVEAELPLVITELINSGVKDIFSPLFIHSVEKQRVFSSLGPMLDFRLAPEQPISGQDLELERKVGCQQLYPVCLAAIGQRGCKVRHDTH